MVKVLLFGHALRHAVGENEIDVELAQPTTVKKFIELNHGQLGAVEPFMTNREVLDDQQEGEHGRFPYQRRRRRENDPPLENVVRRRARHSHLAECVRAYPMARLVDSF